MNDWFDPRSLFGDQQLTAPDLLPLQTSAMMPQLSPSKNQDDSKGNLPVIPSGNLRDALLGKFDDPEIPSGIPDQGQQDQAFAHRALGAGVGQAVDNLQNAANIFKPGAGNAHMGDANRQFGEMLAQRALGNAKERREEALQNFQLKDATDQRHEKMYQMATALKQQRDMNDPNSDLSRQAQAQEAARIDTLIAGAQDPAMQQNLMKRKAILASIPASQIAAGAKEDPTEKLLNMASIERAAGAKTTEEKNKNAQLASRENSQTALGWAGLTESRRQHDMEAKAKEEGKSKLQLNEDKKAEEDIANLRNAKAELDRHIANLRTGKISNDKLAVGGNEVAKFASSLGLPVNPDPALQDMMTSIPLAQATAEKAVTGSSRYTPARWTQFAVQPGEGTKVSINKLTGGSRYLDELIKERMTQLHTNASGEPTSQSAMAKSFPPQAIPNTAAQVQQHTQTGVPSAGEIRAIKGGGKAQQQPDGSWKRIE